MYSQIHLNANRVIHFSKLAHDVNDKMSFRPLTKMELGAGDIKLDDNMSGPESFMSCLVAVGRDQPSIASAIDDALHRGKDVVDGVEFVAR